MPHRHDDTPEPRALRRGHAAAQAPLGPYEMRYDVSRGYDEPAPPSPRRAMTEPGYGARRAPER